MTTFYTSHFSKVLPRPPAPVPLEIVGYVHDDISGDLEIQGLVDKNEKDKKIIDLFRAQLLLPISQRSKTLMKRFGIDVTKNGQVDAWPSSTVVKFHVNAYFPTDATVHTNARLAGAKSKVIGLFTEKSTGNTYYFYFPLSISGVTEDNILKLDHFNTWIYRDTGAPVPDMGDDYNIYHALFDQIQDQNLTQSNAFLATLGMYSEEKGVTFTLRNHNIRVESTVRNPGNTALNIVKQQAIDTPAATVSDEELNHMLLPVGEDSEDPFAELTKKLKESDPELWDDLDQELWDDDEPVELQIPPVEQPVGDIDDLEDLWEQMDADNQQEQEQREVDIPQEQTVPSDGRNGLYMLQTILNNSKYTDKNPFAMLGIKYPDYSVQFKQCASKGYSKLAEPNFVIQRIDKDKKVIDIVNHNRAHHSHIHYGKFTRPELFEKYNSEFISAGNSAGAFKNLDSERDVEYLKKRMKPFTEINDSNFEL